MTAKGGKRLLRLPKRPFGFLDAGCILIALALLLLAVGVGVAPRVLGLSSYVITSDSMEPTLHRGDLLFTQTVSLSELEAGDIVVFLSGGESPVTHRVFSVDVQGGTFRTKADASNRLDPQPVSQAHLLGRAVYRIPQVGHISILLRGEEAGA